MDDAMLFVDKAFEMSRGIHHTIEEVKAIANKFYQHSKGDLLKVVCILSSNLFSKEPENTYYNKTSFFDCILNNLEGKEKILNNYQKELQRATLFFSYDNV